MQRFKRFVSPLATLAGVAGATAAVNRGLLASSAIPINYLGGSQRPWNWRGYEIFVTERGEGPPLLFVHGVYAGASSFEFRKIFAPLAVSHKVIAFDLLGCGLSEMPVVDYSADVFVDQIVDALESLTDEPCTLVASSLAGAFAIRAAARVPGRVARLVVIAPTGLCGILDGSPGAAQRAIGSLVRSPVAGEAFFNALVSRPSLRSFLQRQAYADPAAATDEVVDHYYAVAHQRNARFVPAAFVSGGLNCNVARDLPFVECPLLVLWGERSARTNPVANAREYVRLAKNATLVTFGRSGLLPHEEEPEATQSAIATFAAGGR
jgi:pimeloyl-ACP methyl ester carboxylesterase